MTKKILSYFLKFLSTPYASMLDHYAASCSKKPPTLPEDIDFVIHFCCWGKAYTDKIQRYLYPSMLTLGNLPEVSNKHNVFILIHCSEATKNTLVNAPITQKIMAYAKIKYMVIPEALTKFFQTQHRLSILNYLHQSKYSLLGILQTQALNIAVCRQAYISFLMPDFILSDSFFTNIFKSIKHKKIVLATAFRSNYHSISDALKPCFNTDKTRLYVSAQKARALQVEHIHDAAKRRIVAPSTPYFNPTPQLLFETASGFIVRSAHYHPILIHAQNIRHGFQADGSPIDYTLLNHILSQHVSLTEQIAVCDEGTNIAFIEMSDHNTEPLLLHKRLKFYTKFQKYSQLIKRVAKIIASNPHVMDTPLCRHLFSIENKFESSQHQKIGDCMDSNIFFSDLYRTTQEKI